MTEKASKYLGETGEPLEYEMLIRRRGVIKGQLTRFENFLKELTNDNIIQLNARLEKCREWWDDFELVQTKIEEMSDVGTQEEERAVFQERYFDAISFADSKLKPVQSNTNLNVVSQQQVTDSSQYFRQIERNVKLPTMEIPTYYGSYKGWLEFHDTFKALIHTNESLTSIQKFYYLKNAVKGDAAEVIRALEVSDQNYEEAWKLLRSRYENKKLIALNHIDSLYNFPSITKESGPHLRKFLDTIRRDLRALKTLQIEVEKWDILLIYILEMKLDINTKREWQSVASIDAFSSMERFLDFLEHRCLLLESMNANKSGNRTFISDNKSRTDKTGSARAFVSTNKNTCDLCGGNNHSLFFCKTFLGLSVPLKREEVKKARVCWNCLRSGHMVQDCKLGGCKHCGKKHNTLLHTQAQQEGQNTHREVSGSQSNVA